MKFIILYKNRPDIKERLFGFILETIKKGHNFEENPVSGHSFRTFARWPDQSEIFDIPLGVQCEEVEFSDGKLLSLRCLVTDLEILEKTVDPPAKKD